MLKSPLAFQNFGYPTLFQETYTFLRLINWHLIIHLKLYIMDFIFTLILFFIVIVTKTLAIGVGIYIIYYLYKKYGEKHVPKNKLTDYI